MHALSEHESVVQAVLSLQSPAISLVDLSKSKQPEVSLQPGFLHLLLDVHNAPMSVSSHTPAVALHAYVLHRVSAGQGLVATSAHQRLTEPPPVTLPVQLASSSLVARLEHPESVLMHTGRVQNVATLSHG